MYLGQWRRSEPAPCAERFSVRVFEDRRALENYRERDQALRVEHSGHGDGNKI